MELTYDYDDEILADAVAALDHDGATYELDENVTLRMTIEADDINPFDHDDWLGTIEYRRPEYHAQRPDGFDGNAEVLWFGRSDSYWWQPAKDAPKRGTAEWDAYRQAVIDAGTDGYCVVIIDVEIGTDAVGHRIVAGRGVLGGCDWSGLDSAYTRDMVEDALADARAFGPIPA